MYSRRMSADRPIRALIVGAISSDLERGADPAPGGVVHYAGLALARLGAETRVVTSVRNEESAKLLAPLRAEGVLILASGSATHNLRDWHHYQLDSEPAGYAAAFAEWLDDRVAADDRAALADFLDAAPEGRRNHPSPEHFLPLFVALGAGGNGGGRRLHGSYTYGVFYMGAYAFGGTA